MTHRELNIVLGCVFLVMLIIVIALYWPKKRLKRSDIAEPNLYESLAEGGLRRVKENRESLMYYKDRIDQELEKNNSNIKKLTERVEEESK